MMEPGGNRIELMGDRGYMIVDPAWKTVVWKGSEIPLSALTGPASRCRTRWNYGTPLADEPATPEAAAA